MNRQSLLQIRVFISLRGAFVQGDLPYIRPKRGGGEQGRFVNHEYTNEELMFPGLGKQDHDAKFVGMTQELIDIEMLAHGGSIIEIKNKKDGKWGVDRSSEHARRVNTRTSARVLSSPAAGTEAMKTSANPTGKHVTGIFNNSAGGTMPSGTVLTGEENIRSYFWSDGDKKAVGTDYARYSIFGMEYAWSAYHDRFNIDKKPNESNRFGYIVEVDPYDSNSMPIKRTPWAASPMRVPMPS